jgi:hypothetical protein
MRIPVVSLAVVVPLLVLARSPEVSAQPFDSVGTRARGMGGAFVAVADDATATWWNPAGLAAGPFLSAVLERGRTHDPDQPPVGGAAWQDRVSGFALSYPALGLSYYSVRVSSIEGPRPGRQDGGTENQTLRSFSMSSFGATVGQSVGNHLVVASTVRLARAGAASSAAVPAGDLLDRADELDVPRETFADIDLGALVRVGPLRLGASLKHVTEPELGEGADRFALERQARAGAAIVVQRSGAIDAWTAAVDADLTTTATVLGDERRVAAGGEAWLFGHRLGLRGGVSGSTVGPGRRVSTAGASLAIRRGVFVDAALIPGSDDLRSGWSVSLRSSF